MKLDLLSDLELSYYEEWNTADERGGDCQTIGYAWAAWESHEGQGRLGESVPAVIIIEDDQGFVEAATFDSDEEYEAQVKRLLYSDAEFFVEEEQEA